MSELTAEVQHEAETAVFVMNYDYLWHGIISPDAVAAKLYSNKLIGDVELDAIQSTSAKYPKNSVILSSLKRGPPGTLFKFCGILKDIPELAHIPEKLGKDLQYEVKNLLSASQKQQMPTTGEPETSSTDILQQPIAPFLMKLIELVESEDDLTKYEKDIQQSLQQQDCKVSVEIHCSKASEGSLEKLQLTCTLIEAKIAITVSKTCMKFSLVLAKIIDALHDHEGSLRRMKNCIDHMHLLVPKCGLARVVSLSVQSAKSISVFFNLLGKYWNCIDVHLLKTVIEASECDPALKMLNTFLEDRDCSLPITELIKEIDKSLNTESHVGNDHNCVQVRARVETESLTLKEYSKTKATVGGTLEVPQESLTLSQVKHGCLILMWQMSAELVKCVQSVRVSDANLRFLARQRITEIDIEGHYHLTVPPLSYWRKDASLDTKDDDLSENDQLVTELLQIIETTDEDSGMSLIVAAKYGHSNVVSRLLSQQVNPNTVNRRGKTALDAAVEHEHSGIIETLVAAGGTTGEHMVSELFAMCEAGQLDDIVNLIDCGVSVESVDEETGMRPLMVACRHGHTSVVEFLLSRQTNPNPVDKSGKTALDFVVDHGHLDILNVLIEHGGMIGSSLVEKLIEASQNADFDSVTALLQAGVSVESCNNSGTTPLLAASAGGYSKIVNLLLSHGAKLSTADKTGQTSLDAATAGRHWDVVSKLKEAGALSADVRRGIRLVEASFHGETRTVQDLIREGAPVDYVLKEKNCTALMVASHYGHTKIVQELMRAGANVDIQSQNGKTALDLAREHKHRDILKILRKDGAVNGNEKGIQLIQACSRGETRKVQDLLKRGAPVDYVLKEKNCTALMVASQYGRTEIVQELIRAGANVDIQGLAGCTALMVACQYAHIEVVRELIKAGANLDFRTYKGDTALLYACIKGDAEVVREMITAGANVHIYAHEGYTPLRLACRAGFTKVVQELIKGGTNTDVQGKDGTTAIFEACNSGHTEMVRELIRGAANINIKMMGGATVLMLASQNGLTAIVRELIRGGASLDEQTEAGTTALMSACGNGHIEVVQELTSANADWSIPDMTGSTALMLASQNGHTAIVRELKRAGANVDQQCKQGITALMHASRTGHTEVVQELIRSGASMEMGDEMGNTALMVASSYGQTKVVQELISAGAVLDVLNMMRSTALMVAAKPGGRIEVARALIRAGANVDVQGIENTTALMVACASHNPGMVRVLLENSASAVDIQASNGITALMIACISGDSDIVQVLLEAGATVDKQASYRQTALAVSCFGGHSKIIQMLLDAGASMDIKDEFTCLKTAVLGGHTHVILQLMGLGESVNERSESGMTPLSLACSIARLEVVQVLINAGADVNEQQNESGVKPILIACYSGRLTIVQELIRAGANVNVQDETGWVPLTLACRHGHLSIVKELIRAGATVDAKNEVGLTAWDIASSYGHHEICREIEKHLQALHPQADPQKAAALHIAAMMLLTTAYDEFLNRVKKAKEEMELTTRSGFHLEQPAFPLTIIPVGAN